MCDDQQISIVKYLSSLLIQIKGKKCRKKSHLFRSLGSSSSSVHKSELNSDSFSFDLTLSYESPANGKAVAVYRDKLHVEKFAQRDIRRIF